MMRCLVNTSSNDVLRDERYAKKKDAKTPVAFGLCYPYKNEDLNNSYYITHMHSNLFMFVSRKRGKRWQTGLYISLNLFCGLKTSHLQTAIAAKKDMYTFYIDVL